MFYPLIRLNQPEKVFSVQKFLFRSNVPEKQTSFLCETRKKEVL